MIPALADAGFDGDLDRRIADDRLLVGFRLFGEELDAGYGDDTGRDALGRKGLLGLHGDFDFRTGGEDRHLGVAGRDEIVGAAGREVFFLVFQAHRHQVLAGERNRRWAVVALERQLPDLCRFRGIGRAEDEQVRDGAQCRHVLDRLVRRAVFTETDGIVRQDVDDADAHQSGEADRRTAIVREDQEAAGIGDQTAVQRDTVHGSGHAVLAHAVVDVAAGEVRRRNRLGLARLGVVRAGQVGRAAERFQENAVDDFKRVFRSLAGCRVRLGFGELLLVGRNGRVEAAFEIAGEAADELGLLLGFRLLETGFPFLVGLGRAKTGEAPGVEHVGGNDKGFRFPVQRLAGCGDFVRAERRTVHLVRAGLVRRTEADGRLASDHGRLVGLLCFLDGSSDGVRIMAVDGDRVPLAGAEAGVLVGRVGNRDRAVDRDVVVVPEDDELVELEVAGKRDGFLADAFHEAAVTRDHVGEVFHEVGAELVAQLAFGKCHADGIGNALAERAGRRFDAGGVAVFRVAGGPGAELAEILDLVDRDVFVARQIEQRVEQHRAVTGRQHETVTVRPGRGLRVEGKKAGEKNRCDICCAHGQAGVTGVRLFHGIHGKEANCVRHPVVFFARDHDCSVFFGVLGPTPF